MLHLKRVNAPNEEHLLTIKLDRAKCVHTAWLYTLHATSYEATNSITDPEFIHPVESTLKLSMEA